ncbi:M20/M25/M40 family metallo-hydrolase [Phenylobacterium sp.]|uniref:M20/M25/M40 family metallo-hydrolase n=1 Tax=Phenylobacterium sp. TaxID=1871053 RepID=UPI002F418EB1
MGRTFALAACLIAAALIAWRGERPPDPASRDAPAAAFSAGRALADVEVVARAPHPVGSPANAAVRGHLLRRMTALGLAPRVQRADVAVQAAGDARSGIVGGRVENLVGVLPGRDRALPAVALMAHYDSVPSSPGAADDAAGVAAVLEAVRALKAQGLLRRDVVVALTDGEEANLLGARAFFAENPLAGRLGFVVNLEARGGGGRARMFETGPDNGGTVDLFRRAVSSPSSSSLAVHLYRLMPNETDFTVARAAGLRGLNFAFIGRQFDYHSASSTPASLDQGSLQDIGGQALAAVAAAAQAPALPGPAPDQVYNQLPGGYVLAYPAPVGWAVLAAAAALLALGCVRARKAGALSWRDGLRGAGAGLFLLLAGAALLRAARRAAGAGFGFLEQRRLLAQADRFETALVLLGLGLLLYAAAELARGRRGIALVPLAAGLGGAFVAGFDPACLVLGAAALAVAALALRRPTGAPGAWAGLIATGLTAGVALQVAAPAAALVAAWPTLLAAALAAVSGLWTARSRLNRIVVLVAAALGLGWLGGLVHGLYLGLDAPELLAIPVWLAAIVVWPLAQPDRDVAGTPFVAVGVLFAGLAVLAAVRVLDPWSPRHPQASQVAYLQDRTSGRALRLSLTPDRPAWSDAVLRADGGAVAARPAPPLFRRPVDAAPARPIAAAAPALTLRPSPDGRVVLHAVPPPGADVLVLELVADTPASEVTLNGRPVRLLARPGQTGRIRWRAAQDGLVLAFRPAGPGAIAVRYAAQTPAWPPDARRLPPRPADVMAFDTSDSTIVTGAERLTWAAPSRKPVP